MNNVVKSMILTPFNLLYKVSPEMDLKILFRLKQGYRLDLKNPRTFNEKLQWIKLYGRDPLMPKCCDKYMVREFVKEQGCEDILNRLIWSGFDPKDIPFETLPDKFVIKVTHGSTFNIICTDKKKLDQAKTIETCKRWLKAKFLPCYGEWFYGVEKPRVIVEEFLESDDGEQLRDYKVLCFNGKAEYIRLDSDRFTGHKTDMYDCNWNRLEGIRWRHPNTEKVIPRPACLEEVLAYAEKLSSPFPHARVDFYIVRNKIYFGEITFTSCAGFDRFSSYDFDLQMGEKLLLPQGSVD